jgi:hypothetical protein
MVRWGLASLVKEFFRGRVRRRFSRKVLTKILVVCRRSRSSAGTSTSPNQLFLPLIVRSFSNSHPASQVLRRYGVLLSLVYFTGYLSIPATLTADKILGKISDGQSHQLSRNPKDLPNLFYIL